ncbi:deoxyuridine 5'-triphosphate nucleotidohydrolase-like [Ischnura elegans]|uniref:deoxyuridine 5'-triphosphate nucleotidohydrolase-like n=1 Tax=Ischnura elegans TaxID=197161 RepID=UPI001ED86CD5|nr:deoxyuridine 5'-triphosphate nucleotidohydrolase-like [Ischnura elegans]XP_046408110.1 deoxyuridine 5'-triphosphate nucleotidohydrolase-like [Ischnura elegans]XP_046409271.1 deoxyuridine 5'-triphosphate nucleotidohydrolase-like [Ischnura elegans]
MDTAAAFNDVSSASVTSAADAGINIPLDRDSTLMGISINVRKLHPLATLPYASYSMPAGFDLTAIEESIIPMGGRGLVRTGLCFEIPKGLYGHLASRSGLAVKFGIAVGAGIIDADFRGEIMVLLFNHGGMDFSISPGDRICQIIFEKIATGVTFKVTNETLSMTSRDKGGFGSSDC